MANDLHTIQWFPGHMAKTRRLIAENLRHVNLVAEIVDARIPASSRNPEIDALVGEKPRLLLLNKSDLADEAATRRWIEWYRGQRIPAIAIDAKNGRGLGQFKPAVLAALEGYLQRRREKGMTGHQIRVMVVGVPNVGKSSFINRIAGGKRAKVEDRPGVTRGKQWIKIDEDLELLDMPGILWPKFDDPAVGEKLAFTGAIKDDVMDMEFIAMKLLDILSAQYPEALASRYKLDPEALAACADGFEVLQLIGRKRGMLISGGEIDTERAAIMLVDEYRGQKIGRFTLETPPRAEGAQ